MALLVDLSLLRYCYSCHYYQTECQIVFMNSINRFEENRIGRLHTYKLHFLANC